MAGSLTRKQKVIVAMSGGVDSSIAAAILVEQGYEVIGITMEICPIPKGMPGKFARVCTSSNAIEDARRTAHQLGIEHYTINYRDLFQKHIIDNFVEEYKRGRTPNPCIRCNELVKFGALLEKAKEMGADYLATGHYARVAFSEAEHRWTLMRGVDSSKDQSYALYRLTQEQLAHILLPLGWMTKDETRREAERLGMDVASKPESQEICFVESNDYHAFLRTAAPDVIKPGPMLDTAGKVIGEHKGIAFYTIGQRKGLGISFPEPRYVIRIEPKSNSIVIGLEQDLYATGLVASDVNYISIACPSGKIAVTAKIRYNMKDAQAKLMPLDNKRMSVEFAHPQRATTPGQSVVCYKGESVIGGGTIESVRYNH